MQNVRREKRRKVENNRPSKDKRGLAVRLPVLVHFYELRDREKLQSDQKASLDVPDRPVSLITLVPRPWFESAYLKVHISKTFTQKTMTH